MKMTIGFSQFCDEWNKWEDRKDAFTYNGKRALYDYLEGYEESICSEIELDIVALCCDYREYDSAYNAMAEYQPDDMPVMSEEGDDLVEIAKKEEAEAHNWLEDRTIVIDIEGGGVIIQQF